MMMFNSSNSGFTYKVQNLIFFLLILLNTFVNLIGGSTGGDNFFYASFILLLAYGTTNNFSFKSNFVIKVYLIIAIISTLSLVYAIDVVYVLQDLPRVWSNFFAIIITTVFINSKKRLIICLKILSFCIFLLAIPNFIYTKPSVREMFWGGVNSVGTMMYFGIVYVLMLSFFKKNKYLIALPLFFYVMILSQSQKVIFSLLISLVIFLILNLFRLGFNKSRKYIYILILSSVGMIYLVNYTGLGKAFKRTEATFKEIETGETVTGSAVGSGFRETLIAKGFEYFLESPIIGYGLNQYRPNFGREYGKYTYSHNTWIELLVGFGLIITLIYLVPFIKIFKKTYISFKKTNLPLYIFLGTTLISILIVGQFQKMYYDINTHIFLIIILFMNTVFKNQYLMQNKSNQTL